VEGDQEGADLGLAARPLVAQREVEERFGGQQVVRTPVVFAHLACMRWRKYQEMISSPGETHSPTSATDEGSSTSLVRYDIRCRYRSDVGSSLVSQATPHVSTAPQPPPPRAVASSVARSWRFRRRAVVTARVTRYVYISLRVKYSSRPGGFYRRSTTPEHNLNTHPQGPWRARWRGRGG
jgi:hypothetical protein